MDAFHTFLLAHSATPGDASPPESAQPSPPKASPPKASPLSRYTALWRAQHRAAQAPSAKQRQEDAAAFTALLDRLELMSQRMREAPDAEQAPAEDTPPPADQDPTAFPPPRLLLPATPTPRTPRKPQTRQGMDPPPRTTPHPHPREGSQDYREGAGQGRRSPSQKAIDARGLPPRAPITGCAVCSRRVEVLLDLFFR